MIRSHAPFHRAIAVAIVPALLVAISCFTAASQQPTAPGAAELIHIAPGFAVSADTGIRLQFGEIQRQIASGRESRWRQRQRRGATNHLPDNLLLGNAEPTQVRHDIQDPSLIILNHVDRAIAKHAG